MTQVQFLSTLLFLCHVNDLPESVRSQVGLLADDCVLCRQAHTEAARPQPHAGGGPEELGCMGTKPAERGLMARNVTPC